MQVGGKDIGLLYTVRARIAIAKLTGKHEIADIMSLFKGNEEQQIDNLYKVARILNHEYELKRKLDKGASVDLNENQSILKREDLDTMLSVEFDELTDAVFRTLRGERTVEAVPSKKRTAKS